MVRYATVELEFQPTMTENPPQDQLWKQATSNDGQTVAFWHDVWLSQFKANKETYGDFSEHSCGKFFNLFKGRPAICAGSGPSLKVNADKLKDRGDIPLISCLHNFHYFEDRGIIPDFYVTLDAGIVTLEEVSEGGSREPDDYWNITKDRTLIAYAGSHPELLAKWQGPIYFYNAPIPDEKLNKAIEDVERFNLYFSNGGNVLGSCVYFAKAIMGCETIIFIGADFSFGYPEVKEDGSCNYKFHSWKSKYDNKLGNYLRVTDIFGNSIKSWGSYYNFKCFFENVAIRCPGRWVNATEGGCLGSYPGGNMPAFEYQTLGNVLKAYNINSSIEESAKNPKVATKTILY